MSINECFKSTRLLYRPYQQEDLQTFVEMSHEDSRRRWFYFQEPDCLTPAFWAKIINNNIAAWSKKVNLLEEKAGYDMAIILKSTGALIGSVGLTKYHGPEIELKDIEIGYHFREVYQGCGYGTEAAIAAVGWGFTELHKLGTEPKIVGKAEFENTASRLVLERAGFRYVHSEPYLSVYEIFN
ncbi:GNAT family N-acetyltransferase [Paenibacillus tianjinensis]|uniref:GNAT family N-acetyltransferase n=1 Tax=Paenibacillus tianjinensis TaxID=2810347 RepID=A0ABX7LK41_9BACL|nr:GNAT family N-acetyltransferase [Paenibacillus tianjinensis]